MGDTEPWPATPAPSPEAVEFASILRDSIERGLLSPADLDVLRRAVERAGVQLLMPEPPSRGHGWLETFYVAGNGPYVRHVWREGGRKKRRHLGRLGKAKAPEAPPEIQREFAALEARFLHD